MVRLAVVVAAAAWVPCAWASSPMSGPAAERTPGHVAPVHTAVHSSSVHAAGRNMRHARVHAHRPETHAELRAARPSVPLATGTLPARRGRHAHHRAVLPQHWVVRASSHHNQTKAGGRQTLIAPAGGNLLSVTVLGAEPEQNQSVNAPELPVEQGRGPPRAGPFRADPSLPSAGSDCSPSPASSLPFPLPTPDTRSLSSTAPFRAPVSLPERSVVSMRRPRSRFHADRLEGAVACSFMPSAGGPS